MFSKQILKILFFSFKSLIAINEIRLIYFTNKGGLY